ncbi:MAG: adenosine deaminase family protein [Candidatus Delongbacteria bacterium]|nr:adenosine deaminase family protein [Candidatus Delongbacteria bacterium]
MTHNYPASFIREIPKSDLHVHLDGSLRISTLIELAREYKVELPSYTEAGLRELVYKDKYANLGEYLHGFKYTCAVLRTQEALEQVSYDLAWDNIREGVCYIEIRFAPQLHIHHDLSFEQIMEAVHRGLHRAQNEYNSSSEVTLEGKPSFHYGIIVCAMRMFTAGFSPYFKNLFIVHPHSSNNDIIQMASLELAKGAVKIARETGIPLVGFDLAGQEDGYPAIKHKKAYEYCHQNFLKKTVHAGEAYGAESIFQAISYLYTDRIGHGYYLFDTDRIKDSSISDREEYIQKLANYIANRRVTIEVCLTSNLQTNPSLKNLSDHTFKRMLQEGLSVTLCTDNRLVSNTTVSHEIELAVTHFDITPKKLKNIIIYGFKRNFYWGDYISKRIYCRQVIDYYEKIEQKYGIPKIESE